MLFSKRITTLSFLLFLLGIILINPFQVVASVYSDETVNQINQQRQKQGLTPYTNSDLLTKAARNHNTTMFNCAKTYGVNSCFSHQVTLLSEPYFFDRIKATGYNPQSASENIAWGYTTPTAVVNGWMGSAGHRVNILGNYKDIGCDFLDGLSGSYQGMYWTCNFATSNSQQPTVTPIPLPSLTPTATPTPTTPKTITPTPTSIPQKPWWCAYVPSYPLCK